MRDDHLGDHRHDFLEDLAASWTNSLSGLPMPSGAARLRKPKLLRMLLENFVLSFVGHDLPAIGALRSLRALDHEGGSDVAEDEMAVAVAEI